MVLRYSKTEVCPDCKNKLQFISIDMGKVKTANDKYTCKKHYYCNHCRKTIYKKIPGKVTHAQIMGIFEMKDF